MRYAGRIGLKALQSNALLMAQKKNGSAVINETSLKHFPSNTNPGNNTPLRRSQSPSKASSSGSGKGKAKDKRSTPASDDEGDEDSGDEAEKLDEEQMNEIDTIYRK